MIEDGKPVHWPKMIGGAQSEGEQSATWALAEVRRLIVAHHERAKAQDWRLPHAKTAPIVDVVGGLIADAEAIYGLYTAAEDKVRPLEEQVEALRGEVAESKRPFTAQMQMQNNRIIALTAEVDRLRAELAKTRPSESARTKP